MALPKGKLMALLAVFAAIGLITATGAFTTVTADRTATVSTAGDASANLGLVPYNGPNGYAPSATVSSGGSTPGQDNSYGYAQLSPSPGGTLTIDLGGYTNGATDNRGLNYNAKTEFDNVFTIQNNGPETIRVTIDAIAGNNMGKVNFYSDTSQTNNVTHDGTTSNANYVDIDPGNSVDITIVVDLFDENANTVGSPLVSEIQIIANSVNN